MMNRVQPLYLALLSTLIWVGCSGSEQDANSTEQSERESATPTNPSPSNQATSTQGEATQHNGSETPTPQNTEGGTAFQNPTPSEQGQGTQPNTTPLPDLTPTQGSQSLGSLVINPSHLSFAPVPQGCTHHKSVTVHNDSANALLLESVTLTSDSNSAFDVNVSQAALGSDETIDIPISFNAAATGQASGTLVLTSNEPGTSSTLVSVSAEGIAPPTRLETRVVEVEATLADIILQIDSTGSMESKREEIAEGLASLETLLSNFNLDYHIALLSVNGLARGEFYGSYGTEGLAYVTVSAGAEGYEQLIQNMLSSDFDSNSTEVGLENLENALSETNLTGHNQGFLRDGSDLVFVTFTDEDDTSRGPVSSFADWFNSLKPQGHIYSFGMIPDYEAGSNGETLCSSATRWPQFLELTSGSELNICHDEVSQLNDALIQAFASDNQRYFELAEVPSLNLPIVVSVDGYVIQPDDNNGWKYIGDTNLIEFRGLAIPAHGSSVSITYVPADYCEQ